MSSELDSGSSATPPTETASALPAGAPPADSSTPATEESAARAEMETSVLDALRPLLRPKRKKGDAEAAEVATASDGSEISADASDEPDQAEVGSSPVDELPAADAEPVEKLRAAADDEFESFASIGEELERRSRRSATMVRLLEQHRQQLETAERQRDDAYERLARVVPVVQETGQALREAMGARMVDDEPARMHKLFMLNGRALDELEKVAVDLFADFLWCKSAWEQYARSVEDARKLRSQLDV